MFGWMWGGKKKAQGGGAAAEEVKMPDFSNVRATCPLERNRALDLFPTICQGMLIQVLEQGSN